MNFSEALAVILVYVTLSSLMVSMVLLPAAALYDWMGWIFTPKEGAKCLAVAIGATAALASLLAAIS